MTAAPTLRMAVPLIAVAVVAGLAIALIVQQMQRAPAVATATADATGSAKPASTAQDPAPAALAKAQAETTAVVAALGGSSTSPDAGRDVPAFDIARIEPSGEAVIAGRAAPGAAVELLRNGEVHDRATADPSGQFVMVPPRLPAGSHDLTLRARQADGKQVASGQSVAVAIEPKANERPVVALVAPDKPTVVLSAPSGGKPAGEGVVVDAVESQANGKLHVSGRARPGAALRFYLNESFVASVRAGAEGRFAVTINEGVAPGSYRVRLDEVEQNSGAVRARAEVPFNVPAQAVAASLPAKPAASRAPESTSTAKPPVLTAAAGSPAPVAPPAVAPAPGSATAATAEAGTPSAVVVPKITTATVVRGDSLWRISHLTYGAGMRYAVIYDANREQIRDPDLIYPGQVFVLPADQAQ